MSRLWRMLGALASGIGYFSAASASDWLPGYAHRIPLQVRAPSRPEPLLVVIPGAAVLDRLPGKAWPTSAVRAFGRDGAPWPTQVDERDGTGFFQPYPNRLLEADDGLTSQADVPLDARHPAVIVQRQCPRDSGPAPR